MTQPDSSERFPLHVTVLGAGAWGIVLAAHLARRGHQVAAWDLAPEVIANLKTRRSHPKLPGFALPESVRLTASLEEAMNFSKKTPPEAITTKGDSPEDAFRGPDWVVIVVPSHGVRALAERFQPEKNSSGGPPWILCAKGIEEETLLPMTGVVESVWGTGSRERLAVLSGPSFAAEVARGLPTSVCAASSNPGLSAGVQHLFMSDRFRVYTQDDVLGVELGGALKNVIAIAAGVCDGMGLGDNARAALITRGLAEMTRLGTALGACAETFAGLAGMGDLILTCCGALSRNHTFGELLARGRSVQEALAEIGMVVEGMRTARSARRLAERTGIEMPIVHEVHALLYENKSPKAALEDLMRRDARPERD